MGLAEHIFWFCIWVILYTYFLYPALLFLIWAGAQLWRDADYLLFRTERRVSRLADAELPAVTLIIPARNEEDALPEKLANLRELDYPREKLEVILVSDGSTDRTNEILAQEKPGMLRVILFPRRGGKANALNVAVTQAHHEILVFSDASTIFAPDAVRKLVRHFRDRRVGVVCGALGFHRTTESHQTEGFYWKYESILRLMEGRLGATQTASGAIYALRRKCYRELPRDAVLDDFLIPANARKRGYRVLYDPEATAVEYAAASVQDEFNRRVRLAVGSFRALGELARIPLRSFAPWVFLSHKFLRWILPVFLAGLLLSSLWLVAQPIYALALAAQLLLYGFAAWGYLHRNQRRQSGFVLLSYFLVAMNLAFLVGLMRVWFGSKQVGWQPVKTTLSQPRKIA